MYWLRDGEKEDAPIICVDFDGVIASWDNGTFYAPGRPVDGAGDFLEEISKVGRVVVWTCRTTSSLYGYLPADDLAEDIVSWLNKHELSRHVSGVYAGQGKPYAACYIDDKAIHCNPEVDGLGAYKIAIAQTKAMCNNGKQLINRGHQ